MNRDSTTELSGAYQHVENYSNAIRAYREFLSAVGATLSEMKSEPPTWVKPLMDELKVDFPEADLPAVAKQLIELAERKERAEENEQSDDDPPIRLELEGQTAAAFVAFLKSFNRKVTPERHQQLLYQGILTGLVGQFEVLLADVAHLFFARAPDSLETEERLFSVEDLKRFGSIEDAVQVTIEKRVDDLLRGSAEEWRKFFRSRLKLDLADFSESWVRIEEFIQRRHIYVHAGGRISRRYLANTDPQVVQQLLGEPELGQLARLDEDYVGEALDAFESTGLSWAFAAWCKLFPDEHEGATGLLLELVYHAVLESNWKVVEMLTQWAVNHERFNASTRTTCQMNLWLARKRMGQKEAVAEEIAQFDISALEPRYIVAVLGLVEDFEGFRQLVTDKSGAGLEQKAWDQWPILDELRAEEGFAELRGRYCPTGDNEHRNANRDQSNSANGA